MSTSLGRGAPWRQRIKVCNTGEQNKGKPPCVHCNYTCIDVYTVLVLEGTCTFVNVIFTHPQTEVPSEDRRKDKQHKLAKEMNEQAKVSTADAMSKDIVYVHTII